jgi:UDP-N-acetylglucosamine acyltransferase
MSDITSEEPYIHERALVYPNVLIGKAAWVGAFSSIGAPPEHRSFHPSEEPKFGVNLGKSVVIREGVVIQAGTFRATVVGEGAFVSGNSTIGHDSSLGSGTTLSPGCHIAGESILGDNVTLGMGTAVHQRSRVGNLVMTSMNCVVKGLVPPFLTLVGPFGKVIGPNYIGLERAGLGGLWLEGYMSNLGEVYNGRVPAGLPAGVTEIIEHWLGGDDVN